MMTTTTIKLKSQLGESIAEVLIALLISSLGMLLLASMIATSARLISKSKDRINQYVEAENNLVEQTGGVSGTITINLTDSVGHTIKLTDEIQVGKISATYYVADSVADRPIISYKKE